jgi:hypothetical protein
MEHAKLETAAFAHVDDSYFYGAYCRRCKHAARLSIEKLRERLGDSFALRKVKEQSRCERCRSRQIVITFLAPDQRTGNLVHLFRETTGRCLFSAGPCGRVFANNRFGGAAAVVKAFLPHQTTP